MSSQQEESIAPTQVIDECEQKQDVAAAAAADGTMADRDSSSTSDQSSADAKQKQTKKRKTPDGTKYSPGYTLITAERNRLHRSAEVLKTRNEKRRRNCRSAHTVCSMLTDQMIDFYDDVCAQFDKKFDKYLK